MVETIQAQLLSSHDQPMVQTLCGENGLDPVLSMQLIKYEISMSIFLRDALITVSYYNKIPIY